MTDVRDLIQDLRAHAHEAPEHLRDLIRRAAAELERRQIASIADVAERLGSVRRPLELADAAIAAAPIPPPDEEELDDGA